MAQFVKVAATPEKEDEDVTEFPLDPGGSNTLSLSTLQSQFPTATGLKYKSDTGFWRAIRLENGKLYSPEDGWGQITYVCCNPVPAASARPDYHVGSGKCYCWIL